MTELKRRTGGLRGFLILVLAGLLVVFVIQNASTAEVDFLFWSVQLPRAVLFFVIFAVGAVIGWLTRYFALRPEST